MTEPASPGEQPGPAQSPGGLNTLQIGFLVLSCLGGFFMLRPAANATQLGFRLGVVGVGVLGFLIVTVLRLTSKK